MAVATELEAKLKKRNMLKLEEARDSIYFRILEKRHFNLESVVPILIYFHLLSGGKEHSKVAMPSA